MGCNVFHIKIIILLIFNIKMADVFDRVFDESSWQKAFSSVEDQFEIESLFPLQKEAIKAFIEKDLNTFVSRPTGAGKSLIFQSLPFVFDSLHGNPRATGVVVVISPLKALMKDQ